MAQHSLLSENANLLETTAKVKYVREEVTKKVRAKNTGGSDQGGLVD